eukprot:949277-Rhodomonas_salina.1
MRLVSAEPTAGILSWTLHNISEPAELRSWSKVRTKIYKAGAAIMRPSVAQKSCSSFVLSRRKQYKDGAAMLVSHRQVPTEGADVGFRERDRGDRVENRERERRKGLRSREIGVLGLRVERGRLRR